MASILTTKEVLTFLVGRVPNESILFKRKLDHGIFETALLRYNAAKKQVVTERIDNVKVNHSVSIERFMEIYPTEIPFVWVLEGYDAWFPCAPDPEPKEWFDVDTFTPAMNEVAENDTPQSPY